MLATRKSCLSSLYPPSPPFPVRVSVRDSVRVSVCLFVFRNTDDVKEKRRGRANLLDETMMQWIENGEKQNLTPYKDESLQEYGRMRASLDAAVSVLSGELWWIEFSKRMDIAAQKA